MLPRPSESFLVANGDVLTTLDLRQLIAFHRAQGAVMTIAMHKRSVKIDLGVIETDATLRVTGYTEKPTHHYVVSMGIYVFEPRVIDYIPVGQYLDFPSLVELLLDEGEKICGFPFEGYWQDLGRPDDYEQAAVEFERMRSEFLGEE